MAFSRGPESPQSRCSTLSGCFLKSDGTNLWWPFSSNCASRAREAGHGSYINLDATLTCVPVSLMERNAILTISCDNSVGTIVDEQCCPWFSTFSRRVLISMSIPGCNLLLLVMQFSRVVLGTMIIILEIWPLQSGCCCVFLFNLLAFFLQSSVSPARLIIVLAVREDQNPSLQRVLSFQAPRPKT